MNNGSARTICLTRLAGIPLVLVLASSAAGVHDGGDRVSAGEWLYVGEVVIALIVLLVIVVLVRGGHRNPHTGLPSPIRRKRARGPLSKLKIR
jgi:hypothetical protein